MLGEIDYLNPVNWDHPLNQGLQLWNLVLPNMRGGTKWIDISRRNDGTLTNMDPATAWKPAGGRPGGFGALDFDGTDDYINLHSFVPTYPFSVSAWARPGRLSGEGLTIWSAANSDTTADRHMLLINANNSFRFDALTDSGGAFENYGTIAAVLNQWHFVVGVWESSSSRRVYVDGVAGGIGTATKLPTGINNSQIGRLADSTPNWHFQGPLDDLHVYNRALSATEVFQLYQLSQQGYPGLLNRLSSKSYYFVDAGGGSSVLAAAAIGIGGATIAASATFSPGTKTASVSAGIGGSTIAASGTFTAPVYTATVSAGIGGSTIAASASHAAAIFQASVAAGIGGSTIAASGTFTAPVYTATVAAGIAGSSIAASATHTAPVYTATVAAGIGGCTIAASGTFTAVFTATVSAGIRGATIASNGTFTAPVFTATVALTAGGATIAASELEFVEIPELAWTASGRANTWIAESRPNTWPASARAKTWTATNR